MMIYLDHNENTLLTHTIRTLTLYERLPSMYVCAHVPYHEESECDKIQVDMVQLQYAHLGTKTPKPRDRHPLDKHTTENMYTAAKHVHREEPHSPTFTVQCLVTHDLMLLHASDYRLVMWLATVFRYLC